MINCIPFRKACTGLPEGMHLISEKCALCKRNIHIYCTWFRVAIRLHLAMQTYPHVQPYIRFLSVRPEVCPWVSRFPTSGFLQIPLHNGHPCLRLYPSRYRADLGLAPLRNVRRQAHQKNNEAVISLLRYFRPFPLFQFM